MAIIKPLAKNKATGGKKWSGGGGGGHFAPRAVITQTLKRSGPWSGGGGGGQWLFVPAGGQPRVPAKANKYMDKLDKIDADKKVWVGGLSKDTTWKKLEKHFEETCGTKPKLSEVLPKGKACLAFRDADEASAAIAAVNGSELNGKSIEVDVWTQKEKKAGDHKPQKKFGATFGKFGGKTKFGKDEEWNKSMDKLNKVESEKKVWIGGLSKSTTWKKLEKHFEETCGSKPQISEILPKGKGCCAFGSADEASAAIAAVNGTDLDGNAIEVDVWTQVDKEERKAQREAQKAEIKAKKEAAKAEKEAAKEK